MKMFERVTLRINDDESVTIQIEPCHKESDEGIRTPYYEGELTATAKNMEEAVDKVKGMLSLKGKKGTKPSNVLSEYLKG